MMLKTLRKTLAVVAAAAICLGLAACHKPGETAVTIDGENITSAVYQCAMLAADGEAMQKASKILEESSVGSTNEKYLETKIEDKEYSVWVKDRALEICKEFIAAKRLCEENKVDTKTYTDNAAQNAEIYWQYYGYEQKYSPNGVSFESFKQYMIYNCYQGAYFESVYGEKGKTPISEDELTKHIKANYAYVDVISADLTQLEEDQIPEIQNSINGFADRINAGEAFAKIYAESQGQEYEADESDFGTFSNQYAQIWTNADLKNQYSTPYFKLLADIKEGDVGVVPYTDDSGANQLMLILRADIMNKSNTQLETIKASARTDLKGDEIIKVIEEKAKKLEIKENKSSTNQFKVNKIAYVTEGNVQ